MQVTETINEGLKRELKIVIPASDLDGRLNDRLTELKSKVRLRGFRPGKVPVAHLRKVYGRSVMAELLEQTVSESSQKAIAEREERPAYRPEIKLDDETTGMEAVLSCEADLEFTVAFEVLPAIEIGNLSELALEREVAEVTDSDVDEAVQRIAEQNRSYEPRGETEKAEDGDRLTIDYAGRIDGKLFDGGSETDGQIVLGAGTFIPGFEEQLKGVKTGDSKTVKVTFPETYPAAHLAGKDAEFDVTVKEVARPSEVKIDDEFATSLGMESLEKLREAVRTQIERDFAARSRTKIKRNLLDKLDEQYSFALPESVVEREFESIWGQVTDDLERSGRSFEDEGTTEEKLREDYRKIAERRVRLGLVLAEIGEKNEIKVADEEVNRALMDQVRRYPGQEQAIWQYFQQNPAAVAELRAPIFEDKVVDYILELATVTDKPVSREELFTDPDDDHDHDHDHNHEHGSGSAKGRSKKAAAKKAPSKKSESKKTSKG
jgi:trigger factor